MPLSLHLPTDYDVFQAASACTCTLDHTLQVTKVDICPTHVLEHTLAMLTAILRKPGVRLKPFMVRLPLGSGVLALKCLEAQLARSAARQQSCRFQVIRACGCG